MKKKTVTYHVLERVEKIRDIYYSEDGREFFTEEECLEYENSKKYIRELVLDIHWNIMTDNFIDYDYYTVHWYKVRSGEDISALERFHDFVIPEASRDDILSDGIVCIAEPEESSVCYKPRVYTVSEMKRAAAEYFSRIDRIACPEEMN